VILEDIAAALADLDGKVVHRDLKPENVLVVAASRTSVSPGTPRRLPPRHLKFGLSAAASSEPSPSSTSTLATKPGTSLSPR
jgi:serine/threonine protein kinase